MKCKYKYGNRIREGCCREAVPSRSLCLLHERWDHKDEEETRSEFYREIEGGIEDFEDCIIPSINFKLDLSSRTLELYGHLNFTYATIKGHAMFEDLIMEDICFYDAIVEGNVSFKGSTVKGSVGFVNAIIKGAAHFAPANIADLSFQNATFYGMETQEKACRVAKMTQERAGNRDLADYHFYREMEAKRKQKKPLRRFLELPVQYIFGYGTYWHGVLITWFCAIFGFGLLFWYGHGVMDSSSNMIVESFWRNIYFSIVTATTLGYGDYQPSPGFYQGLAACEAIFGTFMWAAFIAIFARKYMR